MVSYVYIQQVKIAMETPGNTSAALAASNLARLVSRALAARMLPHGVLPAALPVLSRLWEKNGLTQNELCGLVGVEQPTMAKTLGRMVRDGLVCREPDPTDRRRANILPTDRAEALKPVLRRAEDEVNEIICKGMTHFERELFVRFLLQACEGLQKDLSEPFLLLVEVLEDGGRGGDRK
ncbi:MAG: MarR family transcriptional regulator [Desulfovibrionaceae bacterium]|nr:MarR family transcriptional regulator [Desulfovibrionaceae bacterium]